MDNARFFASPNPILGIMHFIFELTDYIEKFQTEFDRLLSKRVQSEAEVP